MSNVDLARELYASFARGDLDAVRAGMTADIAWIEPPSLPYGSQIGFDAVLQNVLVPALGQVEGFGTRPEEWIDGGDAVVVLGHYSGRSVATGRDLDVPFVHILRFRDAKVAEMRISADTHRWMEIVGDTEAPVTPTA